MLSLTVERRDGVRSKDADGLRQAGKVLAVFYGPKVKSTPIVLNAKEFDKIWKKAGESSVIILKEEGGEEHEALIHAVDKHPVTETIRHADFYVIEKGKKVEVSVPLIFDGVSPAVKDKGAILIKVMREIKIEAAPRDLPHELKVDISKLVEFTDTVHAKDIVLPKGVELKVNPEEVVASVKEAKEEVVEAPAAIDMSAIQVETKGKLASAEATAGEESKSAATGVGTKSASDGKKAPEAKK